MGKASQGLTRPYSQQGLTRPYSHITARCSTGAVLPRLLVQWANRPLYTGPLCPLYTGSTQLPVALPDALRAKAAEGLTLVDPLVTEVAAQPPRPLPNYLARGHSRPETWSRRDQPGVLLSVILETER